MATGNLLFVIADDLYPAEEGWDDALEAIANEHDPSKVSYIIKIADSSSARDTKLRHPVVSRKYFDRNGLWNGRYRGMYVDTDLTLRAFWKSAILDGRAIRFKHVHPTQVRNTTETLSFIQGNDKAEYAFGLEQFNKSWPKFAQKTRVYLISARVRSIALASLGARLREAFRMVKQSRLAPSRRATRSANPIQS